MRGWILCGVRCTKEEACHLRIDVLPSTRMWSCHHRDCECQDGRLCRSFLDLEGSRLMSRMRTVAKWTMFETTTENLNACLGRGWLLNSVVLLPCNTLGVSSGQQVALPTGVDVLWVLWVWWPPPTVEDGDERHQVLQDDADAASTAQQQDWYPWSR